MKKERTGCPDYGQQLHKMATCFSEQEQEQSVVSKSKIDQVKYNYYTICTAVYIRLGLEIASSAMSSLIACAMRAGSRCYHTNPTKKKKMPQVWLTRWLHSCTVATAMNQIHRQKIPQRHRNLPLSLPNTSESSYQHVTNVRRPSYSVMQSIHQVLATNGRHWCVIKENHQKEN